MPEARGRDPWIRSRSWWYVSIVFATYVYAPEVRRIADWRSGFASISLLSVLPLLTLVPALFLLPRAMKSSGRGILVVSWLWLGAFLYGLVVAFASSSDLALPAVYAFSTFVLPMGFGIYIASQGWTLAEGYERIASVVLALALPAAVYGIVQFVVVPPWDAAWMLSAHLDSIGVPAPFQLRAFGPLNAPGPFADFLGLALLLKIPRLDLKRPVRLLQMALLVGALAITEVRSTWIAVGLALVIYLALGPNRIKNLTIVGAAVLVCGITLANASAILGDAQAGKALTDRFSTLSDLGNDRSFQERQGYFDGRLSEAVAEPTGQGLGLLGTAAKLGNTGVTADFDNGYVARLTELGFFGTACYLAAVGWAFVVACRRYGAERRLGNEVGQRAAASIVALQAALLFLDVSSDHHNSFNGVFFWISLALASRFVPSATMPIVRWRTARRAS